MKQNNNGDAFSEIQVQVPQSCIFCHWYYYFTSLAIKVRISKALFSHSLLSDSLYQNGCCMFASVLASWLIWTYLLNLSTLRMSRVSSSLFKWPVVQQHCTCTLKSSAACRLRTRHNGTYPVILQLYARNSPETLSFWHNSLTYWIESANIIPHYTARNLLDSTGICAPGRQTIGPWARNVWEGRTGLGFWHLTNARFYLHTPCFPPNTPSCAKASHETLVQPGWRGLIAVVGWVKLRIWLKRSPGVTWMTEQRKRFTKEWGLGRWGKMLSF